MGLVVERLLVIGLGMIGGSVALALRRAGIVKEIVGAGRSLTNLQKGVELNVIDRYTEDFTQEVAHSNVILVAAPVLAMEPIFAKIAACDYRDCIITDVGSVKGSIVAAAERHFAQDFTGFVAAHPIAGREYSGVAAASDILFAGKSTILTPSSQSGNDALVLARRLWQSTGAIVTEMPAPLHDELVSASSHLPHLVAFGLVNYIAGHAKSEKCFELAASGFYDFTRIASSDPIMWRDICLANSDAIARELSAYIKTLELLNTEIVHGNGIAIEEMMNVAKSSRDHYLSQRQT